MCLLSIACSIYDDASYELSEERRKAILELGLPDDGYDYLRHLRAAGPQRAGSLKPLTVCVRLRAHVLACAHSRVCACVCMYRANIRA